MVIKMRKRESSIRKNWRKIWDFLWNSDSIWSWIADLVLLYIIIKLIFFPVLSFILAAPLPSVIVESGSMEHKLAHPCILLSQDGRCLEVDNSVYEICGNKFDKRQKETFDFFWQTCGNWYEERDITKSEFLAWPYPNGIDVGDIIIVSGRWQNNLKEGDIIIFDANQRLPIIHRVIDIDNLSTKGDHNGDHLSGGIEENLPKDKVMGKAIFRIPKLGWAKLIFVKLFSSFKT